MPSHRFYLCGSCSCWPGVQIYWLAIDSVCLARNIYSLHVQIYLPRHRFYLCGSCVSWLGVKIYVPFHRFCVCGSRGYLIHVQIYLPTRRVWVGGSHVCSPSVQMDLPCRFARHTYLRAQPQLCLCSNLCYLRGSCVGAVSVAIGRVWWHIGAAFRFLVEFGVLFGIPPPPVREPCVRDVGPGQRSRRSRTRGALTSLPFRARQILVRPL